MLGKIHEQDYRLLGIVGVIVVFGLVMLSSAGAVMAYQRFGDSYFFVKKQILFGILPGLFVMFIFSKIPYKFWKKISFPLLIFSVILLLSVFIPGLGSTHNTGTHSWITLFGFSLQPSEVVKLTFLLYLASWFDFHGEHGVKDFSYGFLPFAVLLGAIMLLMILQPDIGTMSIIVIIALAMYYVAGAQAKHLAILGTSGFLLFLLLIKIAPYRLARLTIFLHPEFDPQGIGYHINQAFLAIGTGGWFGRGFGQSRQKFNYLPEITGDSIFAIISEELGLVLTTGLLFLFFALAYRGFQIAQDAPDQFSKLVAVGITSWLLFQSFVNIGAMVGLMPLTGVPLPFISYGGTAMLMNLASIGILLNISKHTRKHR